MASKSELALEMVAERLQELHQDVKELREDVQVLKDDFSRRSLIYKAGIYLMGLMGTLAVWAGAHFLGLNK